MARYYSKNYKRLITGKINCYGGGGKWATPITTDTTYKRIQRGCILVRSPWGYWCSLIEDVYRYYKKIERACF